MAGRVRALILVCFLALAMVKSLEQWMGLSGLGSAPRKLIEELNVVATFESLWHTLASKYPFQPP